MFLNRRSQGKGVWVIISKPPLFEKITNDPWIQQHSVFTKDFHSGNLLLYVTSRRR